MILDTPIANGWVHSPYKQPVGARLARAALVDAYGVSGVHAAVCATAQVMAEAANNASIPATHSSTAPSAAVPPVSAHSTAVAPPSPTEADGCCVSDTTAISPHPAAPPSEPVLPIPLCDSHLQKQAV